MPEIEEAGGQVVVVGFSPVEKLRGLAEDTGIPFPVLHDPDYRAYQAFDLKKASRLQLYGWRTLWAYATLVPRRRRFTRTTVDPFQLGGDFVIDGEGIVRYAYRGREPADRPSVSRLVEELRAASP